MHVGAGIAREIACAYNLNFVDPADVPALPIEGPALPVTVESGTGVSRFAVRPVTGIDPKAQSPWWLRRRLMLFRHSPDFTGRRRHQLRDARNRPPDARPRSQPDQRRVHRSVRQAGETVVTLDDITRTLDPADVLIVDDVATAAIGGVMGAGTTEIDNDSTDILLEAAVWDPAAVSRTIRRLRLVSEAGRRYERSVDPAISVAAVDRCAALLAEIAGGTAEPTLTDWRGDPPRDDWSPAGADAFRSARPDCRRRV